MTVALDTNAYSDYLRAVALHASPAARYGMFAMR